MKSRPIILSTAFQRAFSKFTRNNPQLKQAIEKALLRLEQDIYIPELKTHKLSGVLMGSYACSCGYDCRIIFKIIKEENGNESVLLMVSEPTMRFIDIHETADPVLFSPILSAGASVCPWPENEWLYNAEGNRRKRCTKVHCYGYHSINEKTSVLRRQVSIAWGFNPTSFLALQTLHQSPLQMRTMIRS